MNKQTVLLLNSIRSYSITLCVIGLLLILVGVGSLFEYSAKRRLIIGSRVTVNAEMVIDHASHAMKALAAIGVVASTIPTPCCYRLAACAASATTLPGVCVE